MLQLDATMQRVGMQVAGWVGIWVAAVAFYDATAVLTAEVYDHVRAVIPSVQSSPILT